MTEQGLNARGGTRRGLWRPLVVGARWRSVLAVLGFLMAGLGSSASVLGQCSYEVIVLPTPNCAPGTPAGFGGNAINELGNVAGGMACVTDGIGAGLWTGGTVQLLPNPSGYTKATAWGVNESLVIVGTVPLTGSNKPRGVIWERGVPSLLAPPPEGTWSVANAINQDNIVVGRWSNPAFGPGSAAAIWHNGVLANNLHIVLGTPLSSASDISDQGLITGWMGDGGAGDRAFISDGATFTVLPPISGGDTSIGVAINEAAQVVGWGRFMLEDGTLVQRAFFWDGHRMIDLGTLPGHQRSRGSGVSDVGQIIGTSWDPDGAAFLWQNGVMYNLTELIGPCCPTFDNPLAINNSGEIVFGNGPILVRPVGSGPGDLDNNCVVNVDDLLLLLRDWGNTASFADTNSDGTVNVTDLLNLLAHWG